MPDEAAVGYTVLHLHQSSSPAPTSVCVFPGDQSLPSCPGCALLALYGALGSLFLGFCFLKDVPVPGTFQPGISKGTAKFSTHHRIKYCFLFTARGKNLRRTSLLSPLLGGPLPRHAAFGVLHLYMSNPSLPPLMAARIMPLWHQLLAVFHHKMILP